MPIAPHRRRVPTPANIPFVVTPVALYDSHSSPRPHTVAARLFAPTPRYANVVMRRPVSFARSRDAREGRQTCRHARVLQVPLAVKAQNAQVTAVRSSTPH